MLTHRGLIRDVYPLVTVLSVIDFLARADSFALEETAALRSEPLTILFVLASAWWVKSLIFVAVGAARDLHARSILPVAAVSGALAFGITSLLVSLLKDTFERARPAVADPTFEALVTTPGSASFPSGHSATAFAAAVAVAVFCPRLRWPLLGLAVLVALSRVYLGVHYWADIAVGAALGAAIGLAVALVLRRTMELVPRLASPQ